MCGKVGKIHRRRIIAETPERASPGNDLPGLMMAGQRYERGARSAPQQIDRMEGKR